MSGVIACTFHDNKFGVKSFKHLQQLVKAGFNQRRKMLSNALSGLDLPKEILDDEQLMKKRAEQLSVKDFVDISNRWYASKA